MYSKLEVLWPSHGMTHEGEEGRWVGHYYYIKKSLYSIFCLSYAAVGRICFTFEVLYLLSYFIINIYYYYYYFVINIFCCGFFICN